LFDDDRARFEGEYDGVSSANFYRWPVASFDTPGVLDGEAFVVGKRAVTTPEHAPVEILVRHPNGVAHYEFGCDE